jgi:hypothetical protein
MYLDRVSAALGGQGRGIPSRWPKRRSTTGVVEIVHTEQKELVAA